MNEFEEEEDDRVDGALRIEIETLDHEIYKNEVEIEELKQKLPLKEKPRCWVRSFLTDERFSKTNVRGLRTLKGGAWSY